MCPLVVKTGKKSVLLSNIKISYFKICYYHPPTEGSEWGNYHNIRYFIGGVYDSIFLQKYLLNINIYYYYIYLYLEEKFAYWYSVS